MSDYLTKEEIKQWRSSLEKMTLEEYAARLGKSINTEKETNDIVDKVMSHSNLENMSFEEYRPKAETIKNIAQKTILKERELIDKYNKRTAKTSLKSASKNEVKEPEKKKIEIDNEKFIKAVCGEDENKIPEYTFKKALTSREKAVFEHFSAHRNEIIYAKDLAELLGLPRDYIYKYIKTLRNKAETECIVNAENGGFILK